MNTFLTIPHTTRAVPVADIALVELGHRQGNEITQVVMSAAANGFVHETSASVTDVAAAVNAALRAGGGIELVRAHDELWVRPDLVACVETRFDAGRGLRSNTPMLRVVMAAAGGGRPHDLAGGGVDPAAHVQRLADELVANLEGRTCSPPAPVEVAEPGSELDAALARLAYVVPGRHYGTALIEDVETVLNHFGRTNAHDGKTAPA
jgi:hypothetical protein